jgi:1-pyrroline-5-carboxylate dehydrogenase
MSIGLFRTPPPRNEPVLGYAPESPERKRLQQELARQAAEVIEIPLVIGGREVRTTRTAEVVMPHDKHHVLARVHLAGAAEVAQAIEAASRARVAWQAFDFAERAAVFLRAAELLAGPWRERINAATSGASTCTSPSASTTSSPSPRRAFGTASNTARSTASCSPSRPSTSPRSAGTCQARLP